jgi:LDH2 family malate/lactate/ureidoglycolate dehydrogenase
MRKKIKFDTGAAGQAACEYKGEQVKDDKKAGVTHAPFERVREQILMVLTSWGMPADLARTAAQLMAETDLLGIDSHGISMLPNYAQKMAAGGLRIDARPRILRESASSALIDGMGGLGHPVSAQAMNLAVDKALANGVGAVSVRNSHHFGAAGVYARLAVARGVLGLVTSSANGIIMVPTRASRPMLGTNPIAFGAPTAESEPFVLDMATTTVAANKVKVYEYHGKSLPPGWAIDGTGATVTDSAEAMQFIYHRPEGGLTPLGGTAAMSNHKGYGLAMMAQVLGGTLSGSAFAAARAGTRKPGEGDDIGHFFLALNPDAFRDAGSFESDMDDLIGEMHRTPPVNPDEPVLVAGEPEERERERRSAQGIPIPHALAQQLREICATQKIEYVLAA